MNVKEIWTLIRRTFAEYSEDKVPRLAASLSYFTVFSLAPLLVLILGITGFVIGSNVEIRSELVAQVTSLVGEQGGEIVAELIDNTARPAEGLIATIVGIVSLLLGATGLFGQLQDALNTIWEVQPKPSRGVMGMIKDRFLSFTMVLGLSFLLLVSLVVSTALSFVNNYFTELLGGFGILAQILNFIISIGAVTVIFAMIFKILPDVSIAWGDVWIGALVTAVLFTIGRQLISMYLGNAAAADAYGAAGALVLILLWVYYSAQILFIGAEFTQVYARMRGSRIMPAENARAVTDSERAHQGAPRRNVGLESVQQVMVPVIDQPAIHPGMEGNTARERVRYEPRNPNHVIPVIAGGALASVLTVARVVRMLTGGRPAREPRSRQVRRMMRIRR